MWRNIIDYFVITDTKSIITATMLTSLSRLSLSASSSLFHKCPTYFSPSVISQASNCQRLLPLVIVSVSPLHTSDVLERARQSTRIKKRKVHLANKKKKEERLRKNPPPMPKKIQLMLKAKVYGDDLVVNLLIRDKSAANNPCIMTLLFHSPWMNS